MYINIKPASKIHPSNSILKCAIIPIIDTEVSFGISFGALSLTTTYSVLNLFINRCGPFFMIYYYYLNKGLRAFSLPLLLFQTIFNFNL